MLLFISDNLTLLIFLLFCLAAVLWFLHAVFCQKQSMCDRVCKCLEALTEIGRFWI
jgi:hypothetical protein